MEKFTRELQAKMNDQLTKIAQESENALQKAERSYFAVEKLLLQIKEYITNYKFKDQEEEIRFFKEIKPLFLMELIYQQEVYHLEIEKPVGGSAKLKKYYRKEQEWVDKFLRRNRELYNYYRSGKTDKDALYFQREANGRYSLLEYSQDMDSRFSTVYSLKLSKILAFERLNEYLEQLILQTGNDDSSNGDDDKIILTWTASKSNFIELIYGLYATGAINHGRGPLKPIFIALGQRFDIQPGNVYRVMQGMRIRKKTRTPFIKKIESDLERYMDETDLDFME